MENERITGYEFFTLADVFFCREFLGPLSCCLYVLLVVVTVYNGDFIVLQSTKDVNFVPEGHQAQHLLTVTEWIVSKCLNSSLPSSYP